MRPYKLTDEEYGKVLDNVVVGCVDVVVLHKNKILLEQRKVHPIKGEWWIFGGRILIGEELNQTAQRSVLRELGLKAAKDRFINFGTFNLIWPKRREPVETNGCHHLLIAHMIEIDDDEKQVVDSFLSKKHLQTKWHDLAENDYVLKEINSMINLINTSRKS